MTISYARARADFEYLERIAELDDQVELDSRREALMRNPTKAYAAELYVSGIQLWFSEHGKDHADARVQQIADRYE